MARSNGSPRRATLIASAVVVGVILVAGAVLTGRALLGDEPDSGPTARPTSADSSSKCDLPDGDLEKLTEPPIDVEWDLVNTYAIPSSPAGPERTTADGVHHCYARSTDGAVLAAASLPFDLSTPGVSFTKIAELRMTGSGTEDVAAVDALPQEQKDALAVPGVYQIVGFRVDSISRDHAVIQIAYRYSQGARAGTLASSTFDLRWIEGDWRVDTGGTVNSLAPLGDLSGYVEWSGLE